MCGQRVREMVETIVEPDWYPQPKRNYADSALYNIGVEEQATKDAAALITDRLCEIYAQVAVLSRVPHWRVVRSTDGGGVVASYERIARAARRGVEGPVRRDLAVNCSALLP